MSSKVIYTIGHSNREIEEFIEILLGYGVERLYDVRRWPSSRANPQYNMDRLSRSLESVGIEYIWYGEELGGYRKFGYDVDYIDIKCFKSRGFKAYAAYILRSVKAIEALRNIEMSSMDRASVIMCSEYLPYRCHRKIISDWLFSRGYKVIHILDKSRFITHRLSGCASIDGGVLRYV